MASRLFAAAASSSSTSPMAGRIIRRGLCRPADHDWLPKPKVNLWEDPTSPMSWKTSHYVVATLTVWGAFVYVGLKKFDSWKEEMKSRLGASAARLPNFMRRRYLVPSFI